MQTKYIGTILDGRWEVVEKINQNNFKLKNIYNEETITIGRNVFYKILKNETTVSKVIYLRMNPDKFNKRRIYAIRNKKIKHV
jgi:hypothetical protein